MQFAGFTDNDNARNRMNGVKEAIGDKYTEDDRMPDGMDKSKARENVRNAITNHKDLVALVGIWAYNAPAIAASRQRDEHSRQIHRRHVRRPGRRHRGDGRRATSTPWSCRIRSTWACKACGCCSRP